MKSLINIGVRLLSVYFIALPILFACHSFGHEWTADDFHKIGLEKTQLTSTCEFCDFYFDHDTIFQSYSISGIQLAYIGDNHSPDETTLVVSKHTSLLRGPPYV